MGLPGARAPLLICRRGERENPDSIFPATKGRQKHEVAYKRTRADFGSLLTPSSLRTDIELGRRLVRLA
jgi:hypothetical protein